MRRIVLLVSLATLASAGGVAAWRALQPEPEPEPVPLDERSHEQLSEKEREDWMRSLGYID